MTHEVPTASAADTARAVSTVLLPVAARGAIVRRPRVVGAAQRVDADARAVREMRRLRDRYGPGPLQVRLPGRRLTLLLEPDQVRRVLAGTPEPFRPDTREKRGALAHFQPDGVLVSTPAERSLRRPFNEAVLDAGRPLHRLVGPITDLVRAEAGLLDDEITRSGVLTWDDYVTTWMRVVRRVVLGDRARDDERTTDLLLGLRRDANWSFARPRRTERRRRFLARLQGHLDRAEPGSLAEVVAATPAAPGTDPVQQVPQWLFAFDAATWAGLRALALLASHPGAVDRARADLPRLPDLPFLRACVLESLRLWPTTPAILRDTGEETRWEGGSLPAGASVLVFAPFFHRDETRLPEAHRFAPELWLRRRTERDWPLVPFSGGPGTCPGRNLVLLTTSLLLACLVEHRLSRVEGAALDPDDRLPGTLSPFGLRFVPAR
ncbi:MAG TPA: cytochrome P450 [Pseudonocardia sp.]|nr:cytochrome P450 [Pseudonocardia sp.]